MKAEELIQLRQGNIIQDEKSNYFRVYGVDCFNTTILTTSIYEWFPCTIFSFIPLIEEELLRFGFEKGYNMWYLPKYSDYEIKHYNIKDKSFHVWFNGINIETNVIYLHELQNMWFALTGEELIIKF